MKKKLTAIFAGVIMLATLAACNKEESGDITTMNMNKYMKLGEYKGLTVDYIPDEVTDDSVEEEIKSILIANSEKIGVKEGKVKNGDLVNVDYVGYKDGVAFDGGTAKSQNIRVGAGNYIPGFEEAMVGMTPGETVEAEMTFPEEYHSSELAGQDVVFAITCNFIYPEITDEVVVAMESDKYGTKDEFYTYVEEKVRSDAEENNSSNITALAFEKILENSEFKEVPESIKKMQKEDLEKKYKVAIDAGAGDLETVVQYIYGCSADELIDVYAKQRMAIQAIAKAEGIEVTDAEIDERLSELAEESGTDPQGYLDANEITREKFKELMMQNHRLDAVFSLPAEMFYPGASVVACCMIWELGIRHEAANQPTFFGYFKEDGFTKRKILGRVERVDPKTGEGAWKAIHDKWLHLYQTRTAEVGLSAVQKVSYEDEWCAEAYMETDYNDLSEKDFIQKLVDYSAFLVQNEEI